MYLKKCFLLIFILNFYSLNAQFNDNYWAFGQNCGLNFSTNPPQTFISNTAAFEISTSISSQNGGLLAYLSLNPPINSSFGVIRNAENEIILNGDSIITNSTLASSAFFLPHPSNSKQFYLVHVGLDSSTTSLYYSFLDMSLNNGNGMITQKNVRIFTDYFGEGISATKHGNGYDWWIVLRDITYGFSGPNCTNKFIKFLLNSNGFQGPYFQNIGPTICEYYGYPSAWLKFSKSGRKMVCCSQISALIDPFLQILNFNRCNGDFYESTSLILQYNASELEPYGIEFSPNDNFLYVSSGAKASLFGNKLTQIDISNPITSESIRNIYQYDSIGGVRMGQLKLASDNKIYVTNFKINQNISFIRDTFTTHLSVINSPNSIGLTCDFSPFSVYLGNDCTCNLDLPSIPNYNLGAISQEDCITSQNKIDDNYIKVFPNPASNNLYIESQKSIKKIKIYDISGKMIQTISSNLQSHTIDISHLPNGIYVLQVDDSGFKKFVVCRE